MTSTDPKPSPYRQTGLLGRTVRRWWLPTLLIGCLGTVVLLSVRAQPVYRAVSLLRVDPPMTGPHSTPVNAAAIEPFIQTQIMLMTSPGVLTAVGTHPKVAVLPRIQAAGDVVQELHKLISVSVIPQTYLIEVAVNSPSNLEAATLVDALVDRYFEAYEASSHGIVAPDQIAKLEAYSHELQIQIEDLERKWKELVARGDLDKTARGSNLINADHGLKIEAKLVENDLKRLEAQAQLDALRGRPVKDPAKIEEMETRVAAAGFLDQALNERRASASFDPKNPKTDDVEIKLVIEERTTLKEIRNSVTRRLELLKFEFKGEPRIRRVHSNGTKVPSQPISSFYREGWLLAIVPFALMLPAFGLFLGLESRRTLKPGVVED